MDIESYIWITTQFTGFHRYPNAPDAVEFLKNEHRHIFKVRIDIEVFHDDREIEFFLFKDFVENEVIDTGRNFQNLSCEMIADEIYAMIRLRYPHRKMIIEVSEDGENGAKKIYNEER